jgi:beta-fructofuranosidase
LYHWVNQKIAISPSGAPGEGIFTGSAVVDVNNTSGFFPNQNNGVVAIYTLNTVAEQTQNIAWSIDGGYTFTKYTGNPVISVNSTQFRDPKVIWHADTQKWVMAVSHATDLVISFYTSSDLQEWTFGSNFSNYGLRGSQWECPNLVTMPLIEGSDDGENVTTSTIYLLLVSVNPGAPLGGSISQYFPGSFNGTHFVPVDNVTRLTDFAMDNYAGQFFYGLPDGGAQVSIGWASNWLYAESVPTGELEGWRSAMSVPRLNTLRANVSGAGYDLISLPFGLETLYDSQLANQTLGNGNVLVDYANVSSGAVYFQANMSGVPTTAASGTLKFTFSSSVSGENVTSGFSLADELFMIDRGDTHGFNNSDFAPTFSTNSTISSNGTWSVEGVLDRSLLEVFLAEGVKSATVSFFPNASLDTFELATDGLSEGTSVTVTVWTLKSAWADEEVGGGNTTVVGNTTSTT